MQTAIFAECTSFIHPAVMPRLPCEKHKHNQKFENGKKWAKQKLDSEWKKCKCGYAWVRARQRQMFIP